MTTDINETETTPIPSDRRTMVGLLRWSWNQYHQHPELVGPFALATLLVVIAQAGITTTSTPYGIIPTFESWVWPVYAVSLGSILIGFGTSFLTAADSIDGSQRPFPRRVRIAIERLPSMLFAGILGGIAVGGGLLTLLVPGLYLMLKLSLAFPACVIDNLDAVSGLRRSWPLTGGSLLTIGGLLSLYAGFTVVVSIFVTATFGRSPNPGFIGPFIQNALMAVFAPLFGLAFGRLYLVRRG